LGSKPLSSRSGSKNQLPDPAALVLQLNRQKMLVEGEAPEVQGPHVGPLDPVLQVVLLLTCEDHTGGDPAEELDVGLLPLVLEVEIYGEGLGGNVHLLDSVDPNPHLHHGGIPLLGRYRAAQAAEEEGKEQEQEPMPPWPSPFSSLGGFIALGPVNPKI